MTSPIDRTAKAALDTNLNNGITADAPKVKSNNDVVYDYVDTLNQDAQNHAGAAVLPHADESVTGPKIAPAAVSYVKLASDVTSKFDGLAASFASAIDSTKLTDYGVVNVKDKAFGAKGDFITDDTTAIQLAINSLDLYSTLLIPKGNYLISSLTFNKSYINVICYGQLISNTTDTAILINAQNVTFYGLKVSRNAGTSGIAQNDFLYKGLVIRDSKNITLYSPDVRGFMYGVNIDSPTSGGCAYIDIFAPMLFGNLISYKVTTSGSGWANETHVFGGRFEIGNNLTDYTGSAYFDLVGDSHRFIGISAESFGIARKIKGNFNECTWEACRFEGSNGVLDIEITGNGNRLINNRDLENIISNTGTRNVISTSWKTETSIITGIVPNILTATSSAHDFTVNVESSVYLIDSSQNVSSITFPQASDKYLRYVPVTVKKTDYSTNTISVGVQNGRTDHSLRTFTLTKQGESVTLMSDGTRWRVIGYYSFNETSATSGFDLRTFDVGAEITNNAITTSSMYASKVCVSAGTNGAATVYATGTSGQNTVTLTGPDLGKIDVGQYITIGSAGSFTIKAWDGTTATLSGNLGSTVSAQVLTYTAPVFRKKDPIRVEMSAAPTTGTWALGDLVYNTSPSEQGTAGGKYVIRGWICVAAGTPGTWVQDRGLTGN